MLEQRKVLLLIKEGDSCKTEVKHRLLIKEGNSRTIEKKMKTLNKRGGLSYIGRKLILLSFIKRNNGSKNNSY